MTQEPLLSLCIPTYNRVAYLRELIPVLLRELDAVNTPERLRVWLEIWDNASPDGTERYLSEVSRPDIILQRNETNIGGDNNIRKCIERSSGEYVWVFGDDDMLAPGGLARVLEGIEKHSPTLLILVERGGTDLALYPDYGACVRDELKRDRLFSLSHTLISANVFKREMFDAEASVARKKTNYGHMYGLMDGLKKGGMVVVLDGVLQTRELRAAFAHIPFALCVKQAMYLRNLASWFTAPELKKMSLCLAANLPVELASNVMHTLFPRFMRRRLARKAARHG